MRKNRRKNVKINFTKKNSVKQIDFSDLNSILPHLQNIQQKIGFIEDLSVSINTKHFGVEYDNSDFYVIDFNIWVISKKCFMYNETFWDSKTSSMCEDNKEKYKALVRLAETIQ